MSVVYVGRESFFHGKSIFEIARNLKNYGVGRYVVRKSFQRYSEPSFYKLTHVEPLMNAKGYFRGVAYGEKVFRGKSYGVCQINAGSKHDWILIPKEDEQALLDSLKDAKLPTGNVIQPLVQVPPLMEILMRDEALADGHVVTNSNFYCKRKICNTKYHLSQTGEHVYTHPITFTTDTNESQKES